ncbi:hypothetical protein [Synechococcus sp. CS-1332]|uniref:hypothetical protein n=1 Tax=Synechococcus sp. CS-1332 TaxID=2847972 RepID=UPI00223B7326|nr:hypothetical protein [Synechococcus sp. CS-1332]MCT0206105.1 hypothetical protein [Synechococcus sp. CS-1332]
MWGLEHLRCRGIPFQVIAVITEESLSRPHAELAYRQFLQRFWELWQEHPGQMRVREFEGICSLAQADARLDCSDMNNPFAIVNVDARGAIATFDPELLSVQTDTYGDFVLGDVRSDSLVSIAGKAKFQRILSDMRAGTDRCRSECAYFGLCGGGAGSNKYWERGTFACTQTQACRYRIKLTADVARAGLEEALGLVS